MLSGPKKVRYGLLYTSDVHSRLSSFLPLHDCVEQRKAPQTPKCPQLGMQSAWKSFKDADKHPVTPPMQQCRQKASIRPLERAGSKSKDSSLPRPSTNSLGQSNKSRDERRLVQRTGDLNVHVKSSNLATLHKPRREPKERTASSSIHQRTTPTQAPTPVNTTSTSAPDTDRPLAPSSSRSNLGLRPEISKVSLKEDPNDLTPDPSGVGNAGPSTIRRFQSLSFLRRKRSVGSSVAQLSSNMSQSTGSSHGHGTTHSNSSNGSHSQLQQQPQGQASQPAPPSRSDSFSASTVTPSLSRSSTLTLIATTGSSILSVNNPPRVSFAKPPKADRISRRSLSLDATSSAPNITSNECPRLLRRRVGSIKRAIHTPPTKTRTVARTPCTYDVTSTRPSRPRSSSLPVDPALQAAIASTSLCTSRSENEHARSSHFSEAKEAQTIKAHGARRTSHNRPLNMSSSLTDILSSYTLAPMTLQPQGMSVTASPRAHNRYAAVYRPPPPLDADGYARAGQPRPALSLSMPTGVSIIEPLPPSDTLPALPVSSTAARGISSRNPSPSSPYPQRLSSLPPGSSSPLRPPPRAPVPKSPDDSPKTRRKPLPTLAIISGNFTASALPTVASTLRANTGPIPWVRQRAYSTARISNMPSSWAGDERPTSVATHNYFINSNANNSGPNPTSDNAGGAKNATLNKINYAPGSRLGTSSTRTIYTNTPTIPISNQRRPSLPITPTASEFSIASTPTDESLWGYFERSGLASPPSQRRELSRSRSANALSQTPSRSSDNRASIYEETLDSSASTPPLSTTPLLTAPKLRDRSRGLSVNMGKSVHSVYVSSPSSSSSHTPQTPNSGSLQTPSLTSSASPSSPYTHQRPPTTSPAPKINHGSTDSPPNTIKLSSAHTIILREPPSTRPQRAQRPTHLTSYSLPSPKADSSFMTLDPPVHSQVLYLDPARYRVDLNMDSPSAFFNSPYPSPGVTFPTTPVTPRTPWIGSGKNRDGDADSLVLPPSPGRY